jgi:Na+/H+ antiporter NhaD/arsenite permease-like protein
VALSFAGIFTTMIPALLLLNAHASAIGLSRPWQFFWGSGLLSIVLDNAPTYLTFASAAAGIHGIAPDGRYLEALVLRSSGDALLVAVAAGSAHPCPGLAGRRAPSRAGGPHPVPPLRERRGGQG